jgi:Leucine-rich repeat (LRR) protein
MTHNNITDVAPLRFLINLEFLALSTNGNLSDISPLKSLTNLKMLDLYFMPKLPLNSKQVVDFQAAVPNCIVNGA